MTAPLPLVMVAGRGAGKTTALATWLLDGSFRYPAARQAPVLGPIDWSRRIVVVDQQRAAHVLGEVENVARRDGVTLERERRNMLLGCILTADRARDLMRGMHRDVEIVVDDAETVLAALIGRPVRAMTITGATWPAPVEQHRRTP